MINGCFRVSTPRPTPARGARKKRGSQERKRGTRLGGCSRSRKILGCRIQQSPGKSLIIVISIGGGEGVFPLTHVPLSMSVEKRHRRVTSPRKRKHEIKTLKEEEKTQRARKGKNEDTNGLFHARSTALTRRRYSIRRDGRESSRYRLSVDSWYSVVLGEPRRSLATRQRRRREEGRKRERERSDGRARRFAPIDRSVTPAPLRYSARLNSTEGFLPL